MASEQTYPSVNLDDEGAERDEAKPDGGEKAPLPTFFVQ
jgi:hypothetical protein